jgi:hypothetical protein
MKKAFQVCWPTKVVVYRMSWKAPHINAPKAAMQRTANAVDKTPPPGVAPCRSSGEALPSDGWSSAVAPAGGSIRPR